LSLQSEISEYDRDTEIEFDQIGSLALSPVSSNSSKTKRKKKPKKLPTLATEELEAHVAGLLLQEVEEKQQQEKALVSFCAMCRSLGQAKGH
jgi:hypothetical protein